MALTTPFLTALAPGAAVVGSRDPLGLLPVWTRVARGRRGDADATGITNVTTVSGDLRGWTTLMIALGLARRFGGDPFDTECFFRAEQVIGYARVWAAEVDGSVPAAAGNVRGVSRIRAHLREAGQCGGSVALGTLTRETTILGSQSSGGVWGQISAAAESSGLVHRKGRVMAPAARELWEGAWWPQLKPYRRALEKLVKGSTSLSLTTHAELLRALARLHGDRLLADEVAPYRRHVLEGKGGAVLGSAAQEELVASVLAGEAVGGAPESRADVLAWATRAEKSGRSSAGELLRTMAGSEQLLGPMEKAFSWLLGWHKEPWADVVTALEGVWPGPAAWAEAAHDELLTASLDAYGRGRDGPGHLLLLQQSRTALVSGDVERFLRSLVDLNAWVMGFRRRGGPWVAVDDGVVVVDMGDESSGLGPDDRDATWVHSYYLEPLQRLVRAWQEGQDGEG